MGPLPLSVRPGVNLAGSVLVVLLGAVTATPLQADLLRTVIAAYETNLGAFPRGELDFETECRFGTEHHANSGTLQWVDDSCYWNVKTLWRRPESDRRPTACEIIHTPQMHAVYVKEWNNVTIAPARGKNTFSDDRDLAFLKPTRWEVDNGIRPFVDYLNGKAFPELLPKLEVRVEGDRVRVLRPLGDSFVQSIDFALDQGGRAVKATVANTTSRVDTSRWEATWAEHGSTGKYYPTRVAFRDNRRKPLDDRRPAEFELTVKITRFDPNADIPRRRFDLESFTVPNDATIIERHENGEITKRKQREGALPSLESRLESSIREFRATGFGKSDRERSGIK